MTEAARIQGADVRRVVILGATSTIAMEVARQLAVGGSSLLLVARSIERLTALRADLLARGACEVATYASDLGAVPQHASVLEHACSTFPDFETVLLAYGSMREQKDSQESMATLLEELQVNFVSAAALLSLFAADLERRRTGCLAAITSVAGDRGRRSNYVYGSAKGGLSLFLQGLRSRLHPAGVHVLTIKPGPVRTSMTDHLPGAERFADPVEVAREIVRALERRSPDVLYTPKVWRYVMTAVRAMPERFFKRLSF